MPARALSEVCRPAGASSSAHLAPGAEYTLTLIAPGAEYTLTLIAPGAEYTLTLIAAMTLD
jgi:hypothetical protein